MLDETACSVSYSGGEGQSVFPIPFPFLETTHIRARIRDAEGRNRALAAGSDYTVKRGADGRGECILLRDALADGCVLTVGRLVPLTQEILFRDQGTVSPRAVEEAADKLTMIAQQLQDGISSPSGVCPSAEISGAFLCSGADGGAEWRSGAAAAGLLPLMSETGKGVARIARGSGLELDAGGFLRIAPDNLISKANLEARLAALSQRLDAMEGTARAAGGSRTGEFRELPDGEAAERAPGNPSSPEMKSRSGRRYLTRSGVYHAEGCLHTRAAGEWLEREEILRRSPAARPCSRCLPSPGEGAMGSA